MSTRRTKKAVKRVKDLPAKGERVKGGSASLSLALQNKMQNAQQFEQSLSKIDNAISQTDQGIVSNLK
jgi:hypothetical protein